MFQTKNKVNLLIHLLTLKVDFKFIYSKYQQFLKPKYPVIYIIVYLFHFIPLKYAFWNKPGFN